MTTTRISWSGALGSTSITFGLLKSRCTTPTRCAAARPAAICRAMGRMSVGLESPLPVEPVGQRLAAEQLHRKKNDLSYRSVSTWRAVAEHIVDSTDVGMRHLPRQVHFALEERDRALAIRDRRQDRLEGDPFAQLQIFRLIELAHAALRQVADDAKAEGHDIAGAKDGLRRSCPLRPTGASGRGLVIRVARRRRRLRLGLTTEQALNGEVCVDARDHFFTAQKAS